MLRIEATEFLANFSAILTLEIQGYWSEADTQNSFYTVLLMFNIVKKVHDVVVNRPTTSPECQRGNFTECPAL